MADKPKVTGAEVAAQAKRMKLQHERSAHAEMGGKGSRFTPARLDHLHKLEDLEAGQVIGVLDTELAGDETDLPPGKYNVHVRKREDGEWEAVAEADGRVVSRAARVTVRKEKEHPRGKGHAGELPPPDFREHGWCWCGWAPIGPFWLYICVCW